MPGEQVLIWRSHYEHSDIPDAIAIIGLDGLMRCFDSRGVHRVYDATLDDGTFSDDGDTIGAVRAQSGQWWGCSGRDLASQPAKIAAVRSETKL